MRGHRLQERFGLFQRAVLSGRIVHLHSIGSSVTFVLPADAKG